MENYRNILNAKEIILYGASSSGSRALNNLLFMKVNPSVIRFYDSNPEKQGRNFLGMPVLSESEFLSRSRDVLIIISSCIKHEISDFLSEQKFTNFFYEHGLVYSDRLYEKFDSAFVEHLKGVACISNMDYDELYTLYNSCKACKNIQGDIAEVGVYKGGSAYLMTCVEKDKDIYLFDTFEGLPPENNTDINGGEIEIQPSSGWLDDTSADSTLDFVLRSGINKSRVHIKKGWFPATAEGLENKVFSLVNLDSDLYQTTYDCIEFFYPRLATGGRLISHDYNCLGCPGVKQAYKDYFGKLNLEHLLIELAESQVMVIKQ
jgi:O-methyltransferase